MNQKIKRAPWLNNTTLSRDYFIFATICICAAIIACFTLSWQIYHTYIEKTEHTLSVDANRINRTLTDTFNETNQIMVYIGKQIAKTGGHDLNFIANLLKNTSGIEYKSTNWVSWSGFDWVGTNNLQLVNSKAGIASNPPDMSHREYSWKSPQHPWTLQLSKPAFGNPSKTWTIPAGTGITNEQGKYIGTLVVGFNIAEITTKVEQAIHGSSTSFIVVDNNNHIIIHSSDIEIEGNSDLSQQLQQKNLFKNDDDDFANPIEYQQVTYHHYKKMVDYPYIILTGYNHQLVNKEFYSLLLPRITEFLLVGIFCLILLYAFRKRIVTPLIKLSDTAAQIAKGNLDVSIPRQTSLEMHQLATSIINVKRSIKSNTRYQTKLANAEAELQLAEALKEKNKELQETKERLEYTASLVKASDDAREEFMRRIDQEMEIPLETILSYSDVLIKHIEGDIEVNINKEQQVGFLKQVHDSALDLKMLTTRILDIEEIDVAKVISQCVTIHTKEALLKNIVLSSSIAKKIPVFYADDLRFKQIVLGLISRSIEYSPKDGIIEVAVNTFTEKERKWLRLTVSDNGFGLTEADIQRLSDKFGKRGVSRKAVGTDLDLSSIEKLIRMHQGKCKIESKLGVGTKVIVTFPFLTKEEANLNEKNDTAITTNNIIPLFS
jgi:two-component system, sensor histidine kinase ChiS